MRNQEIEQKTKIVKVEQMASRRSSFYFGLSNRVIVPLLYISAFTLVNVTPYVLILPLTMIIIEIVIRYGLKSTLRDELLGVWNFMFGTKRKRIRN